MSQDNNPALLAFLATSFLATATILIGYSVNNWQQANMGMGTNYALPTTPATGEHTAH